MKERVRRLRRSLPRGRLLPDEVWARRHQGIVWLLWAHVPFTLAFALVRGFGFWHSLGETAIVLAPAIAANAGRVPRRARTAIASVGLLTASAVLVHLSGGVIEMHFHFFVIVAAVALYQDWVPFLAAVAYVLVHHGLMGAIDPRSVYNHPAAIAGPWKWAGIHSIFITGISAALLVTWRLNEDMLGKSRLAEERLREETHAVEQLNEVGKMLTASLDLRATVQRVTDVATDLTGAAFGAFFYNVVGPGNESYMLYTISGVEESAFAHLPMPRNTALFGATFRGESVVRLDDVAEDPRYGTMPPYHGMPRGHLPVRSYLAVPVRSRDGSVLGGLFFGHPERARFGPTQERLAVGVAAHASVAIDNANLYESERRARAVAEQAQQRLSIMAEATRVLSSSLEVEGILRSLADRIAPALADSCDVYLVADDGSIRRVASHIEPALAEIFRDVPAYHVDPANQADPVARAIHTGHTQVIERFTDEDLIALFPDPVLRKAVRRLGPRASIVAPLMRRDRAIGAIAAGMNSLSDRWLGPADVPFVDELANRVAIAVENAQLFAAQRTAAATLQHSLLPERLPELPGLALSARYVPGGSGVEIGGDWYDVITLPEGQLGLVMGDVVGRGVGAASLMGQLRNALRAYAIEGVSPGEALGKLNRMLFELRSSRPQMATVVFAIFDPDSGALRVASAGHPPPLVVGPEGSATFLRQTPGVPLGVVPGARFQETMHGLALGSALVLYTDGLVEDRATSLESGMERLRANAEGGPADPRRLCDALVEGAGARGDNHDDVAVLAMRYSPLGEALTLRLPARPGELRHMRSVLRRWLVESGASESETFEILTAAGEACANAVTHGATGAAVFELEARRDEGIGIVVRSQGSWREPRPTFGGRGLRIIEEFMDAVDVRRDGESTEVRMRRAIGAAVTGSPA